MRTLATLTIGQAPRPDVTPIIDAHVPPHVRRLHSGMLDGMTAAEIEARYRPEPDEPVLITRLSDGGSVQLSARKARQGVQEKIATLDAAGCDVILLLCTGTFPGLRCERSFLLEPDRIIPAAVAGIVGAHRLGIVVPLASQMHSESGKWGALASAPVFAASSPYGDPLSALAGAGAVLKERRAQSLLLDCMGFTERHRRALADATDLPVILSNALMAKVVGEFLA